MERLESFAELLRDTFPARSELVALEFVAAELRDERGVVVTIRLVVWERGADGVGSGSEGPTGEGAAGGPRARAEPPPRPSVARTQPR